MLQSGKQWDKSEVLAHIHLYKLNKSGDDKPPYKIPLLMWKYTHIITSHKNMT